VINSTVSQSNTTSPLITHVIYSGLGGHSAVLLTLLRCTVFSVFRHHIIFAGIESPNPFTVSAIHALGLSYSYVKRHDSFFSYLSFINQIAKQINTSSSSLTLFHGLSCVPASLLIKSPSIVRDTQNSELKTVTDWFLLLFANLFCSRLIYLTTLSASAAHQKLKLFYRKSKVSIIPNPVDNTIFKPAAYSSGDSTFKSPIKLGMVSRLQPIKDHRTLLDGFYLLSTLDPSRDYELHIAGEGPTYEDIRKYINALSLSDSVCMHGLLSPLDISLLLQSLHIYIHLTDGETMSNSILQAMATCLPIIATDVSGVNNCLTVNEAILIPPRSAYDLASAIITLATNQSLSSRLASNSLLKVQNTNSPSSISLLYINVIHSLI
jgi:glycosyltransferase involved in cell wall biosynthesis